MDPFADLVREVRADGALLGQSVLRPPWSLRYVHGARLTMCAMLEGSGWVVPAAGEPARLDAGGTAVVVGPEPFVIADEPDRPPEVTVHSGEMCTSTSTGENLVTSARLGPRSWDTSAEGGASLLIGAYTAPGDVGRRLLGALPPVLVVPAGSAPCVDLDLLATEVCGEQPGQQVVLDRLLDLMLVWTLRAWFEREDADPPAWYSALGDPVIGPVLHAIHDDPGHPWTVVGLARVAGVSRAAFARRFTALVGEPPLTYLTDWRMTIAADLLRREGSSVGAVARRVGYADGVAFSSAFKRVRGVSPSAYRAERSPAARVSS